LVEAARDQIAMVIYTPKVIPIKMKFQVV
jgi:hypothetical protein